MTSALLAAAAVLPAGAEWVIPPGREAIVSRIAGGASGECRFVGARIEEKTATLRFECAGDSGTLELVPPESPQAHRRAGGFGFVVEDLPLALVDALARRAEDEAEPLWQRLPEPPPPPVATAPPEPTPPMPTHAPPGARLRIVAAAGYLVLLMGLGAGLWRGMGSAPG